jgi:hydrogenase/urease accessory protein HupE
MPILAVSFATLFAAVAPLSPHDPGLSSVRVARSADAVVVHAAFANADFRAACGLDGDGDGRIDAAELARGDAELHALANAQFLLVVDGARVGGALQSASIAENADVELVLRWATAASADATALELPFLRRLSRGHRCYTMLAGAGDEIVADALLQPAATAFALPAAAAATAARGFGQSAQFLWLGIEHILIGFDHLAFLLALLAGGCTWRRGVATITAFTVAHSVTLLAAALHLVSLPGLLVEATIAASIVVVAVANLWRRGGAVHRVAFAFGFGLVHGFGFAGVLADLDIGGPDMLLPLVTFNVGVEVGQLAFACVAVPLLALAARSQRGRRVSTWVSIAVGLAGCWWLGERLLG